MSKHQWLYQNEQTDNGSADGPIEESQLVLELDAGRIKPDSFVSSETRTNGRWFRVRSIPQLVRACERGEARRQQQRHQVRRKLESARNYYAAYSALAMSWQRLHKRTAYGLLVVAFATTAFGMINIVWHNQPRIINVIVAAINIVLPVTLTALLITIFFWQKPRRRWVAARHAAELTKSAMFQYAARAEKYSDLITRDAMLDDEQYRIEVIFRRMLRGATVRRDLIDVERANKNGDSWLPMTEFTYSGEGETHSSQDYLTNRLVDQEQNFYKSRMKWMTVITIIVSLVLLGASFLTMYFKTVENAQLWPLVPSIYALLIAYLSHSGYEYLKISYANTAITLGNIRRDWQQLVTDDTSFGSQVALVELFLMHEHRGWRKCTESAIFDIIKCRRSWRAFFVSWKRRIRQRSRRRKLRRNVTTSTALAYTKNLTTSDRIG